MINPEALSEKLLFSTAQINTVTATGTGSATGFFYGCKLPNGLDVAFLVTNKHAVRGALTATIRLHLGRDNPSGHMHDLVLDDFESLFLFHPDPNIDLCIFNFSNVMEQLRAEGKEIYLLSLSPKIIPTQQQLEELSAIEDLVMVGYPAGLVDSVNNLPIVRRGISATHPAVDFNGLPFGAIDIAVFRGSSGSPVFLYNHGSFSTKKGDVMLGQRLLFLGIQFSGAQAEAEGRVVIEPTPVTGEIATTTLVFAHLAFYVKARELQTFVQQYIDARFPARVP